MVDAGLNATLDKEFVMFKILFAILRAWTNYARC
jgi:hypothetical protein